MNYKYFALAPLAMSVLFSGLALGCSDNEYEQCATINLGITTYKDCKCFPKIGGPIGQTAQDAKTEANKLTTNIINGVQNAPADIQSCLSNVPQCASEIATAPFAFPIQAYIDGLYRQSEGKTHPFSNEFISLAQPYYSVDLHSINWAEDINTGTENSVSYCDRVFFVGHGNLWQDQSELYHVLHELEHTVQCQQRGKRTYLAEYILKAGLDVLKTARFDVHDVHDFEVAANAKADQATAPIWAKIQNGAPRPQPQIAQAPRPIPAPGPIQVPPPQMNPVRFCQTLLGTCQIPPVMAPMGTSCFCNLPNGQQINGGAF
jgi:hypothetical protein